MFTLVTKIMVKNQNRYYRMTEKEKVQFGSAHTPYSNNA